MRNIFPMIAVGAAALFAGLVAGMLLVANFPDQFLVSEAEAGTRNYPTTTAPSSDTRLGYPTRMDGRRLCPMGYNIRVQVDVLIDGKKRKLELRDCNWEALFKKKWEWQTTVPFAIGRGGRK